MRKVLIISTITAILLTMVSLDYHIKDLDDIRINTSSKFSTKTSAAFGTESKKKRENEVAPLSTLTMIRQKIAGNATGNRPILILTYHAIDDKIFGVRDMFISPGEFDKQMAYLRNNNYHTITFEQLDQADSFIKPVIITFDDGYEDNYTYAYPILKKYNFTATIFLISKAIGEPIYLKLEQINQMKEIIDFQSHTVSHPHLTQLPITQIDFELSQSKYQLEIMLNKNIDVLSYPYSEYNHQVIAVTKKYYKYAVIQSGEGTWNYRIRRIPIVWGDDLKKFEQLVKANGM
jgi:peptidoglycan/xylan/chitin deacetylase (PgdA/CDA1 family)